MQRPFKTSSPEPPFESPGVGPPKSCSTLPNTLRRGYQLLGLNRGGTRRSLCQHQPGGGNVVMPAKPGDTRRGAGRRKAVFTLSKESPRSEPPGLRGEAQLGSVFPHPPAVGRPLRHGGRFGGMLEPSEAREVTFRRNPASRSRNPSPSPPPHLMLHQERRSHRERGAGGSRGCVLTSTRRCDLVFP